MKAFVTGGSGFIGQRIVRQLIERGDTVYALARSERSAGILSELGAYIVPGDITDIDSMRSGMQGCDVVFHVAAWYKIGALSHSEAEAVNVVGTRRILRLAIELEIPKIIYTSSIVVFGDTRGQLVDETYLSGGPFLTEYDRTKWLAHYKVARPLIEKGAPIVIVMPGLVFGRGDQSVLSDMMRLFYRGLPVLAGPETIVTYSHVDDIAEGHILAAEMGRIGESYILAGPAISLGDMIDFWGHLTGRPTPIFRIPASLLKPFVPLLDFVKGFIPIPSLFSAESVTMLGTTYIASSEKAKQELGWQTRPLQSQMLDTLNWIAEEEESRAESPVGRQQRWAMAALFAGLVFLIWWLLGRKAKSEK